MDSIESTQLAVDAVTGSLRQSDSLFDGFIGVDAEWQASIIGVYCMNITMSN